MTTAKRPLPSLRFTIYYLRPSMVPQLIMRLIPQTTPRGKVLPNLWALPGGRIENTEQLIERCKAHDWRYQITGSDGAAKRGRRPT